MYIQTLVFISIHSVQYNIQYNCTYFYLLFFLEFICCSRSCCFTAPLGMSNNDNMLIYVNQTQLKYQNKNVNIVKI